MYSVGISECGERKARFLSLGALSRMRNGLRLLDSSVWEMDAGIMWDMNV